MSLLPALSLLLDVIAACLLLGGAVFMSFGTLALLRFPDTLSRLHALTKADNVGLGLIALGLALEGRDVLVASELLLAWVLLMFGGATAAHVLAGRVLPASASTYREPAERVS